MTASIQRLVYVGSALVAALAAWLAIPMSSNASDENLASPVAAVVQPVGLGEDALARFDGIGARLLIGAIASGEPQDIADGPPRVVGLVRVGGRSWVYVGDGTKPQRIVVGQSVGGWTLVGVGGNFAQFQQGGRVERVRLFAGRPAQAARDDKALLAGPPESSVAAPMRSPADELRGDHPD